MGRKRKVPIAEGEEKENGTENSNSTMVMQNGPMYTIMSKAQLNDSFHKRQIKEMKQLYAKMDHDAFFFTFIKMIKSAMEAEECNEYADTALQFCAKFVSAFNGEETSLLFADTFNWLLTTISNDPHIRFRLCQFVNKILYALGQEAALDDRICDRIMEYMLDRLRDIAPTVRVQAILAIHRLQLPDNPDDPVLRAYQYHLCSDPSARVRLSVITCMGRNYHTIPYILDRLWDIDEKVRRHTYLEMSSYPVRSYKVAQRLMLLEQGLNDRSESVRKVVTTVMLQQWIESYQHDLVALISALKLDANEDEINRFRKITKQTLKEIFKRKNKKDLVGWIPLEEDGEFHQCVPHEKLTIEVALYWQCLVEFLQNEMAEELDVILPELSTFCAYVERFCETMRPDMDKFELMEFQYVLLSLIEILYTFDLGDEIGRGNLHKLVTSLLKNCILDEKVIQVIVRCTENLITDQTARLQYFVDIIQDICDLNAKPNYLVHDRALIEELLANSANPDLKFKLSTLKVKILDLEEQQTNFEKNENYESAQRISEERIAATDEYITLLRPLLEKNAASGTEERPFQLIKVVKPENILKSLQIAFHMVVSRRVNSLNPSVVQMYKDFICRHFASNQITVRDWALKCGTAYSMLYEPLAKGIVLELYRQFIRITNIRLWETSITCIFELLDRYGVQNFAMQTDQNKSKKAGRLLYHTLDSANFDEESVGSVDEENVDIIRTMSHFLDRCLDVCIVRAIVKGFCRLILHGYIKSPDIIEKLLLRYFNPATDVEVNQVLGIFLENLIKCKKHGLLQPCLLPTISKVLNATYDSPLHEIRPETITRFFIDSTREEPGSNSATIHNRIALTFLKEMLDNSSNKELCKLLAKELTSLEVNVSQNEQLKEEMKSIADALMTSEFDSKVISNITDFKDMLDGKFNPPAKGVEDNESDDEQRKSDDETLPAMAMPATTAATSLTLANVDSTVPDSVGETTEEAMPETGNETNDTEALNDTPTTMYGRENRVGHRHLRKSLNISRDQSDTDVVVGPSRPPKIRIEARIDSDKKSSGAKEMAKRLLSGAKALRARRSLHGKETSGDDEPNEQSRMETDDTVDRSEASTMETQLQNELERDREGSTTRQRNPAEQRPSKLPVRSSSRKAKVVQVQKPNRQKGITEELNTSDVVPASPSSKSTRNTSRLRRAANTTVTATTTATSSATNASTVAATINTTTATRFTRSAKSNAAVAPVPAPSKSGGSGVLSKNSAQKRHPHTDGNTSTSPPLKRKRGVPPASPSISAITVDSVSSPARKQLRTEVRTQVEEPSQRAARPSATDVSKNNQSKSPAVAMSTEEVIEKIFRKNCVVRLNNRRSAGAYHSAREGGTSTSDLPRSNQQSQVHTRGRLSLQNTSSKKAPSQQRVTPAKLKALSRIPVRTDFRRQYTDDSNFGSSKISSVTTGNKVGDHQLFSRTLRMNKANSKPATGPVSLARTARGAVSSPAKDAPTPRLTRRSNVS